MSARNVSRNVLWVFAGLSVLGLLLVTHARAQEWHIANQLTMAWDPVGLEGGGSPGAGEITYTVYLMKEGELEQEIESGVQTTEFTFTFPQEGRYFLGVKAVRIVDGNEIESSRIAWSNTDGSPNNWGALHYARPTVPVSLIKQ